MKDLDIGGTQISLFADKLTEPKQFKVITCQGVKTQWGIRIDYTLTDLEGYAEYKVSSWNLCYKTKINALSLLGVKVELVQSKILPNKIDLTIIG